VNFEPVYSFNVPNKRTYGVCDISHFTSTCFCMTMPFSGSSQQA